VALKAVAPQFVLLSLQATAPQRGLFGQVRQRRLERYGEIVS
jgi:hypothetical protein